MLLGSGNGRGSPVSTRCTYAIALVTMGVVMSWLSSTSIRYDFSEETYNLGTNSGQPFDVGKGRKPLRLHLTVPQAPVIGKDWSRTSTCLYPSFETPLIWSEAALGKVRWKLRRC